MEPWVDLCEQALAKMVTRLGITAPVPLRELAYAVATFYLGVNLLTPPRGRPHRHPLQEAV